MSTTFVAILEHVDGIGPSVSVKTSRQFRIDNHQRQEIAESLRRYSTTSRWENTPGLIGLKFERVRRCWAGEIESTRIIRRKFLE